MCNEIPQDQNGVALTPGDWVAIDLKTVHNDEWTIGRIKTYLLNNCLRLLMHPDHENSFEYTTMAHRCILIKRDKADFTA
jgi:hypothetical protein